MIDHKCPKCDRQMVAGFLLEENTSAANPESEIAPTEWVAIDREHFDKNGTFKDSHIIERIAVETFRCYDCGYLESFAKTPLGD